MSTPEGAFSVFPLDAAVTAPAGALSVFHHYRCSDCSPQERYLYFPTAPAVIAPAQRYLYSLTAAAVLAPTGAFSSPPPTPTRFFPFPHCRSSARSRRSFLCIPPLPQQCLLPKEPFLYFPLDAAVTAPAGALSVFLTTAVGTAPLRSATCNFLTAPAVIAPAGALSVFPHCRSSASLQQEPSLLPPPPPTSLLLHYRSSACSCRNLLYIPHYPQ